MTAVLLSLVTPVCDVVIGGCRGVVRIVRRGSRRYRRMVRAVRGEVGSNMARIVRMVFGEGGCSMVSEEGDCVFSAS